MSPGAAGTISAEAFVHPTAHIDDGVTIGRGTRVWHEVHIRERASIGEECILGKSVYIDREVTVGNRVKIQNRASLYRGVTIEDGVFIGPHVIFANDRMPRAINPDGSLKSDEDWVIIRTHIRYGASLGAGTIILPGITVGRFALTGSGAVVTHDVADHALVVGNPARLVGYVCICGARLIDSMQDPSKREWRCPSCNRTYQGTEVGLAIV